MGTPTINAEQRQNIRWALRSHPDILEHVGSLSEITRLTKSRLVELLDALGIDFEDARSGAYYRRISSPDQCEELYGNHPFSGALEFDFDLSIAGGTYRKTFLVDYEATPEWPFYDPSTATKRTARAGSTWTLFVKNGKRKDRDLPSAAPRRVERQKTYRGFTEVTELTPLLYDTPFEHVIEDKIDEECLRDNAATRRAYANVIPLRQFKAAPDPLRSPTSILEMVDTMMAEIGKAINIVPCDDHWHADVIDGATRTVESEFDFQSNAETREAATYDLYWKIAFDLQARSSVPGAED